MENFAVLTLIATFMLVIVTSIYTWLTHKLVTENKILIEAQTRPKISVKYKSHEDNIALMNLAVENIGMGPAFNLEFNISPDIKCYRGGGDKYLSEYSWFREGLKYLAPNQEVKHFLNYLGEMEEGEISTAYKGKVNYEDALGKKYEDKFIIDFSHRKDLECIKEKTIREILSDIEKHLEDLVKQKR